MKTQTLSYIQHTVIGSFLFMILSFVPFISSGQCDVSHASPSSLSFSASGGSKYVYVYTTSSSCEAQIGMYPPWLTVTKLSSTKFRITASPNSSTSARNSNVTFFVDGRSVSDPINEPSRDFTIESVPVDSNGVAIPMDSLTLVGASTSTDIGTVSTEAIFPPVTFDDLSITVTQDGAAPPASLTLDKSSMSFTSSGGSSSFTITSNTSYTISDNASWLSCSSSSGSGNKTVTVTCNSTTSTSSSSGTITVSGDGITRTISVSRSGAAKYIDAPSPMSFTSSGGSKTLFISSNTSYSISDNKNWLSCSSSSGSGNKTITVTCNSTTSTSDESGTITLSGGGITETVTVNRSGAPAYINVTPTSLSYDHNGGSKTFSISSNTSYTISDNKSWILRSSSSGSDNKTVTVTVTSTTSTSDDSGTVTVSGSGITKTVDIERSGAPVNLSVTPSSLDFPSSGGSKTFSITSNTSYSISDNKSWIDRSSYSGSGNKTVTITCDPATSTSSSSGTVTVSGGGKTATVSISRAGLVLNAGSISGAQTICLGEEASRLNNSSSASGCSGIDYQWQYSTNNSTWYDISNTNSSSYSPGIVTSTRYFRRKAISGQCGEKYTGSVKVTVRDYSGQLALNDYSQTINYNSTPSQIALQTPIADADYQWYQSSTAIMTDMYGVPNLSNATPISLAHNSYYQPSQLTQTRHYILEVQVDGCTFYTAPSTVHVRELFNAGVLSEPQGICYNTQPAAITFITSPSGGTGSYTYQWYYRNEGTSTWTTIQGDTATSYSEPDNLTQTRDYRVRVSSGGVNKYTQTTVNVYNQLDGGSITGALAVMTGQSPGMLTSTNSASGGSYSHTYQWEQKIGTGAWQTISGATDATYTPGTLTTATSFRRKVTDSQCGSAYSNTHDITVNYPSIPADGINVSATGGTIVEGDAVTLSVNGGSLGANGQWKWYSGSCGNTYIGEGNSIEVSPATTTSYYVRAEGEPGGTTDCASCVVNVINTPSVQGGGTICWGETTTIYCTDQASVQYTLYKNGAAQGSASSTPSWNVDEEGNYTIKGTLNGVTANMNSSKNVAFAAINPDWLTLDRPSQSIDYNKNPLPISFESPYPQECDYQWYESTSPARVNHTTNIPDMDGFVEIENARSSSYSPPKLTQSRYYIVKVSYGGCNYWTTADVYVYPELDVPALPVQRICYNTTPATFTFSEPVSGGRGSSSYTYQWYYRADDEVIWTSIPGATSSSYTELAALTENRGYRVEVTSGTVTKSTQTMVFVYSQLSDGGTITASVTTIDEGLLPGEITSTVNPIGGSGKNRYQWFSKTNNSTWQAISGADELIYTPEALTDTTSYYREVTDTICNTSLNSNEVTINVIKTLEGGQISCIDTNIDNGETPASIISEVDITGGDGNYTITWEQHVPTDAAGIWTPIDGEAGVNYQPAALVQTTTYRRKVEDGLGHTAYSNELTINVSLYGGDIACMDQLIDPETTPSLITSTADASGGAGGYTYEWQQRMPTDPQGQWFTLPGEANTTCQVAALETTTYYFRKVTDLDGATATSDTLKIQVKLLAGAIACADSIIDPGIIPQEITDSISPQGGAGGYAYWWETKLPSDETWTVIENETSLTYQAIEGLTETTLFRRGVSDVELDTAYTEALMIIVDGSLVPPVALNYTGATLKVHKGKLSADALWHWYDEGDNLLDAEMLGEYTVPSLNRSKRYRVRAEWDVKDEEDVIIGRKSTYQVSRNIQRKENINLDDNRNYILTYTPEKGVDDIADIEYLEDQGAVVQYFDGLGRATQTVAVGNSYYFNDMVAQVTYDDYGRQDKQHLPFTTGGNGAYVEGWESQLGNFYNGQNGIVDHNKQKYTQTVYEASPLNRVEQVINPDGDAITYTYGTNTSNDNVTLWKVDANGDCITSGDYLPGTLHKTTVTDEVGNETIEYKDLLGRVVRKTAKGDSSTGDDAHTYYVYDDFGLLRYVLPPKAVKAISGNITKDNAIVKGLCYYYQYDHRKRMIVKQLPGAEPVYMVYDARDRLVLVQDGETRRKNSYKWMYTMYEELNRPVETGWVTAPTTDSTQIRTDFSTIADLENTTDLPLGYTDTEMLTKTYYDEYKTSSSLSGVNNKVKGQVTRTLTKLLNGSNNTITTDFFYDDKYRTLQTVVTGAPINQVITNQYDFTGKVTQSEEQYTGEVDKTITKHYTYDHGGRLEKVEQEIDGDAHNGQVILADMDYNELGQLTQKRMHCANDTSYVQYIDYAYNIQGWLKQMNNPDDSANMYQLYAQALDYYNNGNISAMQWANMQWFDVDSDNDSIVPGNRRQYGFEYDAFNRLTDANYSEFGYADGMAVSTGADFTVNGIKYDLNGNIEALHRKGNTNGASNPVVNYGMIDQLTYTYANNSNKLNSVTDAATDVLHNKHFATNGITDNDYVYDDNGNMTVDPYKKLDVAYNHLNLPESVEVGDKDAISYLYDAAGVKHQKTGATTTYYGGSVLKDTEKVIIHTGEGRVVKGDDGSWEYQYHLKDHLGNTRITFAADSAKVKLKDVNHYYPFGLEYSLNDLHEQTEGVAQKFKYNGKELQNDFNLDWYDYGARMYDPTIGRWHVIDPLAELSRRFTPYHYASNNPICRIDPDGMKDIKVEDDEKKKYEYHQQKQASNERNEQIKDDKVTISPVANPVISSEFGPREAPINGASTNHKGIDIVQENPKDNSGTPVVAPKNGKVIAIKSKSDGNGAGNRIHIKANTGEVHSVFHMNDSQFGTGLKAGQTVSRGQQLGQMGNTGNSGGAHAHYEIRNKLGGTAQNPRVANSGLTNAPTTAQARAPRPPAGTVTTPFMSYRVDF